MRPSATLVCGMAGSGKTTHAKGLEVSIPAVRLCPDEWIEPLLSSPNNRPEMDSLRPKIEELQLDLAKRLLALSTNIVLENGFWSREERLNYLDAFRAQNALVSLHFLDVPRSEIVRRIKHRNVGLPKGSFHIDPSEIDVWFEWFEKPDASEFNHYDSYEIYRFDA